MPGLSHYRGFGSRHATPQGFRVKACHIKGISSQGLPHRRDLESKPATLRGFRDKACHATGVSGQGLQCQRDSVVKLFAPKGFRVKACHATGVSGKEMPHQKDSDVRPVTLKGFRCKACHTGRVYVQKACHTKVIEIHGRSQHTDLHISLVWSREDKNMRHRPVSLAGRATGLGGADRSSLGSIGVGAYMAAVLEVVKAAIRRDTEEGLLQATCQAVGIEGHLRYTVVSLKGLFMARAFSYRGTSLTRNTHPPGTLLGP